MPERQARAFLDEWAVEHISPTFYGDRDEANALAEQCLADAELSGIASKLIVRSAGGDLETYMLLLLNLPSTKQCRAWSAEIGKSFRPCG